MAQVIVLPPKTCRIEPLKIVRGEICEVMYPVGKGTRRAATQIAAAPDEGIPTAPTVIGAQVADANSRPMSNCRYAYFSRSLITARAFYPYT